MIEKSCLKHDVFNASYGWRINVKAEFDYRQEKKGLFIIEGCSKYMQVPEEKNKKQLLLLNVAMLFEKRWIYKSSGIIVYSRLPDTLLHPIKSNPWIFQFIKDGDCVNVEKSRLWNDVYCEDKIMRMVENYNKGYQRSLPLRLVK
jgi:hypothetical protein